MIRFFLAGAVALALTACMGDKEGGQGLSGTYEHKGEGTTLQLDFRPDSLFSYEYEVCLRFTCRSGWQVQGDSLRIGEGQCRSLDGGACSDTLGAWDVSKGGAVAIRAITATGFEVYQRPGNTRPAAWLTFRKL